MIRATTAFGRSARPPCRRLAYEMRLRTWSGSAALTVRLRYRRSRRDRQVRRSAQCWGTCTKWTSTGSGRNWSSSGTFEVPERRYAAGTAYLRGQGRGRVRAVHGVDELQREIGHLIVEARLPEIGQPASSSYEGEGYVIVRDPNTEVVRDALNRIVSRIRVELVEVQ